MESAQLQRFACLPAPCHAECFSRVGPLVHVHVYLQIIIIYLSERLGGRMGEETQLKGEDSWQEDQ